MKKINTADLTGAALDWAVAKIRTREKSGVGLIIVLRNGRWLDRDRHMYSTDWAQGGPIIDKELIDLNFDIHWVRDPLDPEDNGDRWYASKAGQDELGCYGPTALIAAMRCFCASRLGGEVEVPDEIA